MSAKKTLTIVALAGAAALAAAPAQAGSTTGKPQTRTVKVYDDYFSSQKVTVNRGSVIRWFWPADDYQIHDVKLKSAPKGIRKFQSDPGSAAYVFKRKLTVPGTYKFICTFHVSDGMAMTVVVRH